MSNISIPTTSNNGTYFDRVAKDKPFGWSYILRSPYYRFEELDHFFWPKYIEANRDFAYYAGVVYIIAIFGIQRWMQNRAPLKLKRSLFLWNLGLGVFSIFGFMRTFPGFIYVLLHTENGFYRSICLKEELDVQTAYWVLLFALSKFVELGDTVFIVLRKRKLVVLQWYHHLATMSVVWILAPLVEPIARWYTVLNYGVHSLMYPYFALRAVGIKVPFIIANIITTLQFVQMVAGFTVNMASLFYQKLGYDCVRYPISIQLFGMVYGSFLILFGKLFYDSVLKSGRQRKDDAGSCRSKKND